jgi:hypothetical protein
MNHHQKQQNRTIEELRAASCLDPLVPLGMPPAARPEQGLSVTAYYRRKHSSFGAGRFYPLHQTGRWSTED